MKFIYGCTYSFSTCSINVAGLKDMINEILTRKKKDANQDIL